jgi:hypothetical protein
MGGDRIRTSFLHSALKITVRMISGEMFVVTEVVLQSTCCLGSTQISFSGQWHCKCSSPSIIVVIIVSIFTPYNYRHWYAFHQEMLTRFITEVHLFTEHIHEARL